MQTCTCNTPERQERRICTSYQNWDTLLLESEFYANENDNIIYNVYKLMYMYNQSCE